MPHFKNILSGLFHSSCSFVKFYREIGRWDTDPTPNPTWTWRKWPPRLPAVTLDLCSGPWNRAHIFLHLSLIGLKKGNTNWEDLGLWRRKEISPLGDSNSLSRVEFSCFPPVYIWHETHSRTFLLRYCFSTGQAVWRAANHASPSKPSSLSCGRSC